MSGPASRSRMRANAEETRSGSSATTQPCPVATRPGAHCCGRQHAVEHGVADRVSLEVVDLADGSADWSARYDLAMFFECVHDFPRPVEALRHARQAMRPGGTVLVVEERTAETFTAPGDEVERFFGSASAIWCLPQGRVGPDPEPVGALIRPSDVRQLAGRAGYADVEIVPIEHLFWRFYRLTP
jgi:SAM-dependent methyltransferase